MDPQERLLLEVAWECLERAGHTPEELARRGLRVGVFIGAMWSDYKTLALESSLQGGMRHVVASPASLANRMSHVFGFRGPSITVDTACSSALTALHVAERSLRDGECDMAIVGGVNLIGHPNHLEVIADMTLSSRDAVSRAFGSEGNGWVPGEGVGVALLRPLNAAESDGDSIRAILRGTAAAHGSGRTYGHPNVEAQVGSIRRALANAGIEPSDIDYVECAAGGSPLADASECNALVEALSSRERRTPCLLGSIKPNIGHLESASGLSQLTKVLLQIEHGQVAPTIHAEPLNALMALDGTSLRVNLGLAPWPEKPPTATRAPKRALINAFGGSGSAAHAVLEEYLPESVPAHVEGPFVFVFSAATSEQLTALAGRWVHWLRANARRSYPIRAIDVAYTLQVGRRPMIERLAIVADDLATLERHLGAYAERDGDGDGDGDASFRARADASSQAASPVASGANAELARAWVSGATVRWEDLYVDRPCARVALPTYPFASTSHWLPVALPTANHAGAEAGDPVRQRRFVAMGEAERAEALLDLVRLEASAVLELGSALDASAVEPERPLQELGMTSLMAIGLRNRLAQATGLVLEATLLYDHPTPIALVRRLQEMLVAEASPNPVEEALSALRRLEPLLEANGSDTPGGEAIRRQLEELLSVHRRAHPEPQNDLADLGADDVLAMVRARFGTANEASR